MIAESFESYLARPELNNSMAKLAIRNPEEFRMRQIKGCPTKPQSGAMGFGEYVHALLLEPHRANQFVIKPDDIDTRTKEGKAWIEQNGSKVIITEQEGNCASALVWRMKNHAILHNFVSAEAKKEVTALGDIECIGSVKCRIDSYAHGAICDLKTSSAASVEDFLVDVCSYDYDMQAAFYMEATGIRSWIWGVLSKPTWEVWAINLHDYPEFVRSGQIKLQMAKNAIAKVRKSDYSAEYNFAPLPAKAKWKLDDLAILGLR